MAQHPEKRQQRQQEPKLVKAVQEGSRWRHNKPEGSAVAKWFADNVRLHHVDLAHDDYVQGITLIPASEKVKRTFEKADGSTMQVEAWEQTFTPYVKVETRVAYFWNYMALNPGWVGAIEPVSVPRIPFDNPAGAGYANVHLPEGYFRLPVKHKGDQWTEHIACSMRVAVFDRADSRVVEYTDPATGEPKQRILGKPIMVGAPGTKQVATLTNKGEPDPFAIMKAETGAVGRALGMAGMLVLPGSGVATAEDMQEAMAGPQGAAVSGLDAELPAEQGEQAAKPAADSDDAVRQRIDQLSNELKGHDEQWNDFAAWAQERKLDPEQLKPEQLRAVCRQLEKKLEEATAAA